MSGPFEIGQRVRAKSNAGLVGEIVAVLDTGRGDSSYRVRFSNGTRVVSANSIVVDEAAKDPREQLLARTWAGASELRLLLTGLRIRQQKMTDQLRSLRAARLEHHPYQYKPLLKFLESDHQRVLIADEVGLGKTIEAGLVLSELSARQDLRRVLIVVPANLRLKWQRELRDRFDEEFEIRDLTWVRDVLLEPAGDGELPPFKAITTIEGLRRVAKRFEDARPSIDLVIIDEAHRLRNESTLTYRLGRALSEGAEGMILCSATPMQTKDRDLHNLLRVLMGDSAGSYDDFKRDLEANRPLVRCIGVIMSGKPPQEVAAALDAAAKALPAERSQDRRILAGEANTVRKLPKLSSAQRAELLGTVNRLNIFGGVITRTRKADVLKNRPTRVAKVVDVEFTPEEMAVYNAITEAAGEAVKLYGAWAGATLAMISRARQAASCLAVFLEQIRAAELDDEDASTSLEAEFTPVQEPDDGASGPDTTAGILDRVRRQVARVKLPVDSKLEQFLLYLEQLRTKRDNFKVVVFSTFRGTVHYLSKKLAEHGIGHRVMTGLVLDPAERETIVNDFREDPTCHALLTTEVGGEGIDLQFCDTLVNYDLPWNPMVVEQRIGRLDRLGQRSPEIRIAALNVKGTVEARIVDKLYHRIELFTSAIGPLEVILGERTQKLALELLVSRAEDQARTLEETGIAIENAMRQAAQLDREAVNLLGDDAYYEQRLAEIERAQGNIADDLAKFLRAWLQSNFKHAELVEGSAPGVLKLTADSELMQWLAARKAQRDLSAFARRYAVAGPSGLEVTFKQDVAERRQRLEFITSRHPLIRAVGAALGESKPATQVAAFGVKVTSASVPPGRYLLAIALQDITGIRPRCELVASAVGLVDGALVDDESTTALMSEVARTGTSFVHVTATSAELEQAADRCEMALAEGASRRAVSARPTAS